MTACLSERAERIITGIMLHDKQGRRRLTIDDTVDLMLRARWRLTAGAVADRD